MSDDPDFEYLIVDSTIVRAHQHAAKKGGRDTLSLIVGDTFAIGVLLAVIVATVLAFGFGATSDLGILILGLITSFVESKLRANNIG